MQMKSHPATLCATLLLRFTTPTLTNLHPVNGKRLMVFHPRHIQDPMLSFIKKNEDRVKGSGNINSEVRMADFII
jgi:hypothetical protein